MLINVHWKKSSPVGVDCDFIFSQDAFFDLFIIFSLRNVYENIGTSVPYLWAEGQDE